MPRRRTVRALTLLLIAVMPGAGAPAAAQSAPDAIASVRAFAEQYQREAPSLVVFEEYVQNATYQRGTASNRVTTAELVMVRLQSAAGWITFRDVLTVDKRQVHDREERLLKLLQSPEASALAQARRIAQESARFNLGRITRTINVPDMALEYLQPRTARASVLKRYAMRRSTAGPSSSSDSRSRPVPALFEIWRAPIFSRAAVSGRSLIPARLFALSYWSTIGSLKARARWNSASIRAWGSACRSR